MSKKELDRVAVMEALDRRLIKQKEAARQLGVSTRQVKRLLRCYRQEGPTALVCRRRGAPSNRRLAEATRTEALDLVRTRYPDFGPTLAHEKLTECHGLKLSVETLRQWMVTEGLWRPKTRKAPKAFQMRERRPRFGELVQIDGSPHHWLEKRGPACTLIVFIDDATGKLLYLRFVPAETTQAYMEALRTYLTCYGRPVSLYSDKHGIFRVNAQEPASGENLTQFSRVLKTLDIEAIHAHTPQAKGRVERANQTLQDRLVKELRLAGVCTLEQANAALESFRLDFNRRFARGPQNPADAHRPVLHSEQELELIFCLHSTRILSKNLILQYRNTLYQVQAKGQGLSLRKATVTVCEAFDGTVTLLHRGKPLPYTTFRKGEPPKPVEDDKTLNQRVEQVLTSQACRPKWKPRPDHPWRTPFPKQANRTAPA
jgi:hypothetical protein